MSRRSRKIRVANIIEEARVGGPQVRMVRVAAALKGQAETTILMPRENSEAFVRLCRDADVDFIALPISRITRDWQVALRYVFLFPYEIWRVAQVLKRGRFDIVHVSGGSWQYKGVIAARLAGIPAVWHLNDTSMPGFIRRLFNLVAPLASGFIFASHRSRDYYGANLPRRPEAIVPSTVDTNHFDPNIPWPGDEKILDQLGTAPVIGTIANVNPIKGLEVLICAVGRLRETVPEIRTIIIGAIPERQKSYHDRLQQLARERGVADHVIWAASRSDVRPLLARLDVYVCSSLAESSPISVWEAMAMGKPVVSTDVGDVARHIRDGEGGFMVQVGDDETMADRIRQLLDDPSLRAAMGKHVRKASSAFSPVSIAEQTMDIYHRTIRYFASCKC